MRTSVNTIVSDSTVDIGNVGSSYATVYSIHTHTSFYIGTNCTNIRWYLWCGYLAVLRDSCMYTT